MPETSREAVILSSLTPIPGTFKVSVMASPARSRFLEISQTGKVTVVKFLPSLIIEEQLIQTIGDDLFALIDGVSLAQLLIDFANVKTMSSAMLGKLFGLHKKCQAVSGKLAFCNVSPELRQLLDMFKLPALIKIYPDEMAALLDF